MSALNEFRISDYCKNEKEIENFIKQFAFAFANAILVENRIAYISFDVKTRFISVVYDLTAIFNGTEFMLCHIQASNSGTQFTMDRTPDTTENYAIGFLSKTRDIVFNFDKESQYTFNTYADLFSQAVNDQIRC